MTELPLIGLINNAAMLLALGVLYGQLQHRSDQMHWQIIRGVCFGLIGIGVMMNPWQLAPGVIFDTRSILLSVGGLFLGTVSTLVALVITGAYRLFLGGAGAMPGIGVLVTSGFLGLLWVRLRKRPACLFSGGELYLFGFVVHLGMLLWMLTLPAPANRQVLQTIGLPVLLIFPVVTVLLGKLLAGKELRFLDRLALDKSERQLQNLVEVSPAAIAILKDDHREFVFINRKFTELFGYTLEDLPTIEKWWQLAYPDPAYREAVQQRWLPAVARAIATRTETEPQSARIICKDGSSREIVGQLSSIGEKDIVVLTDVTRERELDQMKSEFIATAAHELRTPLTSIIGFTELLLHEQSMEQARRHELLTIIDKKAGILERIVDDLLDLSRVEAGRVIHLDMNLTDIRALVASAVDAYRQEFPHHRFELDWPGPEPDKLLIDPEKIAQVMENLLSNAVKFSPRGSLITVSGAVHASGVAVTVRDEGIGMSPDQKCRVFDKFYRADSSHTAIPGLGLGMAIAKAIVETHGGKIQVDSQKGLGTIFSFTLPIRSAITS